jgi:hypothetical protein
MQDGYKYRVPAETMAAHLRSYQAQALPEYNNGHRHVYFSAPMKYYITVRKPRGSGSSVEFEFTADCPCSHDD